jgi:cation transport ATPase
MFGAISMIAALATGILVSASHDGTLLPLAGITLMVTSTLFVVTRSLRAHGEHVGAPSR